ncbi:MAG: conjugal transfer protein TraF [Pseudomonadota bacterium]
MAQTALLASVIATGTASAQQLFQPPGANLTLGDVTHGIRALSASGNPAAAAADLAREGEAARSGAVFSAQVGLEYGNIDQIWDYYDQVAQAFAPSDPGEDIGGPGQNPDDKPDDGIDLGQIWDSLDPDVQARVDSVANAVVTQAAALSLILTEGNGKAWVTADAPVVFRTERLGGAWSMQLHWSGTAHAFGLADAIEFDRDTARAAIEDWYNTDIANRPSLLRVGEQVRLLIDELGNVSLSLDNDSLLVAKAAQLTALSVGYGRDLWSGESGTLYAGIDGHLYDMRLSRYGVRFGDITNSEELFDEIRNAEFEKDTRLAFDVGVLWVSNNYQVGAQLRSINEPNFDFPALSTPVRNEDIQRLIAEDSTYTMERQVRLEASVFTRDRRWSFHAGGDANAAPDPVGDDFQWLTASVGFQSRNAWFPGFRVGYRQNLAGTEKSYLSLGATLFKYFNIDIASSVDTVEIDGTTLPEGFMGSIGFQFSW